MSDKTSQPCQTYAGTFEDSMQLTLADWQISRCNHENASLIRFAFRGICKFCNLLSDVASMYRKVCQSAMI